MLPSATEIVAILGLTDRLVGVSAECDWPGEVRDLPVVSASRVDTSTMPAREVDEAVRSAIADGRSLYGIDRALIERLDPDLILTQDLCEVCAVSSGEVGSVCGIPAETVAVDARTVDEIKTSVLSLAERLGAGERGHEVVAGMDARIGDVRDRVQSLPRPKVFVCEWPDPPFAGGHWAPEMVSLAGGDMVLGQAGKPSFQTTWEAVREAAPDLVVMAPCGFDAARTVREAELPLLDCPVVAVDAGAYYSRPSPRIAEGIAQLGFLAHPEAVPNPGLPLINLTANRSMRSGH